MNTDPRKDAESKSDSLDEPVMDGASETFEGNEDPRKGLSDPALIRDVKDGHKTINPYG